MTLPDHRALPDESIFKPRTDLLHVVRDHLEASQSQPVLGEPTLGEPEPRGNLWQCRIKWQTPEGWELSGLAYFNRVKQGWEGPFLDVAFFRDDGLSLSQPETTSLSMAQATCAAAWELQEVRRKRADWNWAKWYGVYSEFGNPAGRQVVAVGDLHGRADLLAEVARRFPRHHLIFLGDYCDRGPDTPGVLRQVRELVTQGRATALLGNHDQWMIEVLTGGQKADDWLANGGQSTLDAYGPQHEQLLTDVQWMQAWLLPWVRIGPVLFSHAMRPDLSEVDQHAHIWGRPIATGGRPPTPLYPLPKGVDHSVHGHTPLEGCPLCLKQPDGSDAWFIDTGAFVTGQLCALEIDLKGGTWKPHLIRAKEPNDAPLIVPLMPQGCS